MVGRMEAGKAVRLFLVLFCVCILFVSCYLPASSYSRSSIDTSRFVEGTTAWGPCNADPGIAYDVQSGELIFNTYQNLITFNGEQYYSFVPQLATNVPTLQNVTMTVTNTSAVVLGGDAMNTPWTDGVTNYTVVWWTDEFGDGFHQSDVITLSPGYNTWTVDSLSGTSAVTLGLWHGRYVFNIDTTHKIYFYDNNGNHVGMFNVTDAAYSLQRYLVMDVPGNPIWMLDKILFDIKYHTGFTNDTAMVLADMIDAAVVSDTVANTLTINVGCHFPDNAFKQILSSTWSAIGSMNNTIAIGGWNGNLFDTSKYGGPFPDWWIDWAGQGNGTNYLTDPSDQLVPSVYVGTGPYHVTTIDENNSKVVLQKNPDFWMGWPAPGSNGSLDTIEIDYIAEWWTREEDLLAGSIDTCTVPNSPLFWDRLLNMKTKEPIIPQIETVKNLPQLASEMYVFDFTINSSSPYIGTGSLPNGIPPNFFNNTHVRKAFAYSFNWSTFDAEVFFGESCYRNNFLIQGLYPDYYSFGTPALGYYESLTNAEAELKAAIFNGTSVWDSGFNFTLPYPTGQNPQFISLTMIVGFFQTLSTFDHRTGKPAFNIVLEEIPWPSYVDAMKQRLLPMLDNKWLGLFELFGGGTNFADADEFTRAYMYSNGFFANYENYTAANGWGNLKDQLVDQAALTPDGPARQSLYTQLQQIFYNDCPSFPVNTPSIRFWCQYWVKGWYHNAMEPSPFYYTMWKADDCWYDVSGSTLGVSDGVVNMKDIAYLIAHFNAKAAIPGQPPDPKWVGVYGANGCVDPYGDRVCNMKDIAGAVIHFNHHANTGTP